MSAFSTIVAAVVALLNVAPAVASGNITRASERDVAQTATTAVAVRIESAEPERIVIKSLDWSSVIAIDVYARGDAPDSVADPILAAIYARIMADPTLGGTVIDCQPQAITWDYAAADTDLCVCTARFAVQHRTTETLT